jgi:hypothetical protein
MEVDIKRGRDNTMKSIDLKAHVFRENRETEMIVAQKFHMKIRSFTTQTRFQSGRNGFLRKTEEKSSEGCQKEERTIMG